LLDACAVINLYATGHMAAMVGSSTAACGIVTRVQQEALYIRRGGTGEDARDLEAIDLSGMISRGLLTVVIPTADELDAFVDLTVELGDGEAMSVAVALERGFTVVTDDRIAVRVIAGRVPVRSSLEFIKDWTDGQYMSPMAITAMLRDLRQRGSYIPGRHQPLRIWWDQHMSGS